jgi:electron transfer flavoprotein beta subunit
MAFGIIVCAKQVPDTNEIKINPNTGTLIREGVPSILNHDDANALEAALALKDRYDDVCVTVVSMGPPQAEEMLLECLAMGADRAVLVSDRAVGGSDTWATSNALAAAIRKLGDVNLIFAGRQAIDGDTAQVGPQMAEKLGLPQVTYVESFEVTGDRKEVVARRQMEDGYEEIKVRTPCVLTAIKELNSPRHMNVGRIYDRQEGDLVIWSAADIEVDLDTVGLEASPTNVFRSFTPVPKGKGVMVEADSDEELAHRLLAALKAKHAI